jgi:sortase (surface protein transpeptidase)
VAALLGVLVAWLLAPRPADPAPAERVTRVAALPLEEPSATTPPPAASAVRARPAAPPPGPVAGTVPTSVTIPRLGVRMPVRPQGVDREGLMALPDTAFAVGWYRFGPRPSDRVGATVLAGHVDTKDEGVGPLARLAGLRPGDRIEVRTARGSVRYAVTSVNRVAKAVLDLPAVFSRTGRPRLHLVTCGGAYLPDQGGYQDNVVVSARRLTSG